jgi:hypothetical protein
MENIIRRKMQEIAPTCYGRYLKEYKLTNLINVEEDLTTLEEMIYKYNITLKLGKAVVCTENDMIYMKDYVIRELINELYGEIYFKLLELRTNIYYGDAPENIKILNELLEYTRP